MVILTGQTFFLKYNSLPHRFAGGRVAVILCLISRYSEFRGHPPLDKRCFAHQSNLGRLEAYLTTPNPNTSKSLEGAQWLE